MGINVEQYYKSETNWLSAGDLPKGNKIPVVVSEITEVDFGNDGKKLGLRFEGKEKGLVLNKTNAKSISYVYGPDTDDWVGKEILLYSTMVDFAGKDVPAIRVDVPMATATDSDIPF